MRMDHTACLSLHAEGNNRLPARTSCLLQFLQQLRFQVVRVDEHLAGGNLFVGRAVKTKFADSRAAFCPHGRTKRAARRRPGIVKFAQSGLRIEHRTDLIVRKFREPPPPDLRRARPFSHCPETPPTIAEPNLAPACEFAPPEPRLSAQAQPAPAAAAPHPVD